MVVGKVVKRKVVKELQSLKEYGDPTVGGSGRRNRGVCVRRVAG